MYLPITSKVSTNYIESIYQLHRKYLPITSKVSTNYIESIYQLHRKYLLGTDIKWSYVNIGSDLTLSGINSRTWLYNTTFVKRPPMAESTAVI